LLPERALVDLSFPRFDTDARVTALPPDVAVMLVGASARQAASPTSLLQFQLAALPVIASLFAPIHGAFNAQVAALLTHWQDE
jgi:hypothetical protein